MKWRKPLAALLSACLLLSCTSCSFVENYFGVTQEDKEIQQEKESHASEVSSALESDGMKKLGETITYNHSTWQDDGSTLKTTLEITINGVQVFENFADSGIPPEETFGGTYSKIVGENYEPPETPFVLVDITIKKVEGVEEYTGRDSCENIYFFYLFSKQQLEWEKENGRGVASIEMDYFSGHGDPGEDFKGDTYFWLDVGEEKDYQIGFFLDNFEEYIGKRDWEPYSWVPEQVVLSADEGLVLAFGINGYQYVDLETDTK